MRSRRALVPALVSVVALLAACSDDPERVVAGGEPGSGPAPTGQRYEANAMVLESADHGPQLCLGGIATSLPPQCGGPDIAGWDWDAVEGEESAAGTTWGSFRVVGTYEDGVFTLTEPPSDPDPRLTDRMEPDFTSPCPEPAGGWAVVDPATATQEAQEAAMAYAQAQPDVAGLWVDQSINPAMGNDLPPEDVEREANDPTKLILNVRFTADLDRHERELRAIWGGALCVSLAEHTEAELAAIQQEVTGEPGMLWSGTDTVRGQVELGVIVDDGLQARLDDRYGEGLVVVIPALRPIS